MAARQQPVPILPVPIRTATAAAAFTPSRRRAFARWSRNGTASLRSIVVAVQSASAAPCST
eukprot:scaffold67359_cov80-Phaeocystis_antarctica.AAC.5